MSDAPSPSSPPESNPHHAKQDGDVREYLPPDLALLLDAVRGEFNSKITSLKLWGIVMCLCGGTLGGILARFAPHAPTDTAQAISSILPF